MEKIKVFIVESSNQGWIIEKLMRDVSKELKRRGVEVNIGGFHSYKGEEIIFNSRYENVHTDLRAKINSVFVTHIDDISKEYEIKYALKNINSIVTMSNDDQCYLSSLLDNKLSVCGIDLPVREKRCSPIKFGIFSAWYKDKRKNEDWLIEYFEKRERYIPYTHVYLLGDGWGGFCQKFEELDLNFEYIRYSRDLNMEYERYKIKLEECKYMLYMGFDGGAMCLYDALSSNVIPIITNDGYHIGVGSSGILFDDKEKFFSILDEIFASYSDKLEFIESRSISNYVDKLLAHWDQVLKKDDSTILTQNSIVNMNTLVKSEILREKRKKHKKLRGVRLKYALIRIIKVIKINLLNKR